MNNYITSYKKTHIISNNVHVIQQSGISSCYKEIKITDNILNTHRILLEERIRQPVESNVVFIVQGGPRQYYNIDFIVLDSHIISWNPLDIQSSLSHKLEISDVILLTYNV